MEEARFAVKSELDTMCFRELAKASGAWQRWFDAGFALLFWALTAQLWYYDSAYKWLYVALAALLTALAVFHVPFYGWLAKRRSKSKEDEVTYLFRDDGLRIESQLQDASLKYEAVMTLKATKKCYFLFVQKKAAYVLPKERFIKGDAAAFAAFIEEKTGLKIKNVRG